MQQAAIPTGRPVSALASVLTLELDCFHQRRPHRPPRRIVSGHRMRKSVQQGVHFEHSMLRSSKGPAYSLAFKPSQSRPLTAKPSPSFRSQKLTVMEALGDSRPSKDEEQAPVNGYEMQLLHKAIRLCQLTKSRYNYRKYL